MFRRHWLLASVLLVASCAQAPSSVSPKDTPVVPQFAPSRPVAPEETLPYPGVLVSPVVQPTAVVPPVATDLPAVATTTGLAFTAWTNYYPDFCCEVPANQLFYYDDLVKDNFVLPGAGSGVANPEAYLGGRFIVYDQAGRILSYDQVNHSVCLFDNLNQGFYTARPSISEDGRMLVYLSYPGAFGGCGEDGGVAFLWADGAVCELAKVNLTAMPEGGVNWIRISADGRWVVFTTALGGLYLYDLQNPMVCAVPDVHDVGCFAAMPDISPDGTQVVFTTLANGRPTVFRYDRLTRCLDPLPFANLAYNAIATLNPQFLGADGVHIYFQALSPEDCYPRFRVLQYDWVTEMVRTLTVLNSAAAGHTVIGGP